MPISETGKGRVAGYTLLEMLAVIVLIGFLAALVYPRFFQSREKVELKLISDLLQSDLRQAKEAALTGQTNTKITFMADGYTFRVGATTVKRILREHQFTLEIPKTEPEIAAGTKPAEEDGTEPKPGELVFTPDGKTTGINLRWRTANFKGTFDVDEKGTLRWSTGPE